MTNVCFNYFCAVSFETWHSIFLQKLGCILGAQKIGVQKIDAQKMPRDFTSVLSGCAEVPFCMAKDRSLRMSDETLHGWLGLFRYSSLWAAFRSGFCGGNDALAGDR
jgi:hypothetical protein